MSTYPGTTGSQIDMKAVEALLVAALCPASWLLTLAAIPWFESGGLTNNLNNTPATGDYSVGLWQINYYGNLFPGREAAFGPPNLLAGNAQAQARAAVAILGGGPGITAWYGDPIGTAAQAGPLSWSEIESIFQAHGVPTDWYQGAGPAPPPVPGPPPTKERQMQVTFDDKGNRWIAAASPQSHLLVFSATPGSQDYSVIDVTDEIEKTHPGTGPYLVQP